MLSFARRSPQKLAFPLLLALLGTPSVGNAEYTRDRAANERIDEAINQRFLGGNFRSAEGLLLGTIKACAGKCSPAVLARAWMYIGLVRSNKQTNPAGAEVAFATAIALDPDVALDEDIATPETQAIFAKLKEGAAPATPTPPDEPMPVPAAPAPSPAAAPPASPAPPPPMSCSPGSIPVQTRRPIPVSCRSQIRARSAELLYREPGSNQWHPITMAVAGGLIRGEIPCGSTEQSGTLAWYVIVKDASGKLVDGFQSAEDPVLTPLAEQVQGSPPSFPGQPPPQRCGEDASVDCPPDFPDCENAPQRECGERDFGSSCSSGQDCKCGLLCSEGTCDTAPSCSADSDCPTGTQCVAGACSAVSTTTDAYPVWWVGVHGGLDLALARGSDLCTLESQESRDHSCFRAGGSDPYPQGNEAPYPGTGVKSTLARGKPRVLLNLDRAVSPSFLVGGRFGYAFGGAPDAGFADAFHLEFRGTWLFAEDALSSAGSKPYLAFGAGRGQLDVKIEGRVFDCLPGNTACVDGTGSAPSNRPVPVDVYAHYGAYFAHTSLGLLLLGDSGLGLAAELKLLLAFPHVTFGMHPSLGVVKGF